MNLDFPPFLVQFLITSLRIRHYQREKWAFKRSQDRNSNRTWAVCLANDKQKLRRLYFRKKEGVNLTEATLWSKVIIHQKIKLKKIYDSYTAWRYTEFRILEKMNQRRFPKQRAMLWFWTEKRQIQKLKRRKQDRVKLSYIPELFMKRQRSKLRILYQREAVKQEDREWKAVKIAMSLKMEHRYGKDWEETSKVQVNKIGRRFGE
ncbi:hypothetical protein [Leptospira alexanderi]|uniref:hypothetical protein n=1 Tax=Leptospira alexanderi TaxID=100053 RepID=UPI000990F093|nr:hypothetical protein [Leptospira alexanderi]